MLKKIKSKYFLIGIIIIASVVRLINLSSVPPHPSLDEVSVGYNAFSILNTGADEYGNNYPILLRAYDDYRPAHYVYGLIPFIQVFGLEVFSVRFFSALLSIATLISTYFLVIFMFDKFKYKKTLSLVSISLLAMSPWHIYISRLGHEVNLFFSAFIFGITFFYMFIHKKKPYAFFFSALFFALSFSSYQSGKVFIPLMLIVLATLYFKDLIKQKVQALGFVIIFTLVCLPVIIVSFTPKALVRFEATNIYSLADPWLKQSAEKVLQAKETGDVFGQIINNRRFVYVLLPANAYLSHFNPLWLFFNGGVEVFKVPQNGLLYIFDLPFLLAGIAFLIITKKIDRKVKIILFSWLLISIIPAAITTGFPHAMRSYQLLPIPQILVAFGMLVIISKIKLKKLAIGLVLVLYLISFTIFIRGYFYLFPQQIAWQFQYGVKEAIEFASKNESNYENIIVENSGNLYQSYMFYLFLEKYDPLKHQLAGGTVSGGYDEEHKIGRYKFGDIPDNIPENSLVLSNPSSLTTGKLLRTVKFRDGRPSIELREY